jgi:hypothetical protein
MVDQIFRLDLSQVDSPRIHHFHQYWQSKRAGPDVLPLRGDFDPAHVRALLPNMMILEVEREPLRFRYRLVGTRVVDFNHREFTGQYLGTIGWQEERQLIRVCVEVTEARVPQCGAYTWTLRNGGIGKCEFGVFPFSHDGRTVAQLFAIEDYDFPRDAGAAAPRRPR